MGLALWWTLLGLWCGVLRELVHSWEIKYAHWTTYKTRQLSCTSLNRRWCRLITAVQNVLSCVSSFVDQRILALKLHILTCIILNIVDVSALRLLFGLNFACQVVYDSWACNSLLCYRVSLLLLAISERVLLLVREEWHWILDDALYLRIPRQ